MDDYNHRVDAPKPKVMWSCPWWRVEEQQFTGPAGQSGLWYTVRRPNPNTVHILAVTHERMVPLVRQYRVPFGSPVWELPAGLCDVASESMEDSARRELLEETGYRAGRIEKLITATVSPGLTDEVYNAFLAIDLTHEHEGGGTGDEDIEVHMVPLEQLSSFILDRAMAGEWVDSKIVAHIMLAQRRLKELAGEE